MERGGCTRVHIIRVSIFLVYVMRFGEVKVRSDKTNSFRIGGRKKWKERVEKKNIALFSKVIVSNVIYTILIHFVSSG